MDTALETERNNLKGFNQNIDNVTKQDNILNYVVSEWSTHFAKEFIKSWIQKAIV